MGTPRTTSRSVAPRATWAPRLGHPTAALLLYAALTGCSLWAPTVDEFSSQGDGSGGQPSTGGAFQLQSGLSYELRNDYHGQCMTSSDESNNIVGWSCDSSQEWQQIELKADGNRWTMRAGTDDPNDCWTFGGDSGVDCVHVPCTGSPTQLFQIHLLTDGNSRIVNDEGRCATLNSARDGDYVFFDSCTSGNDDQLWQLTPL